MSSLMAPDEITGSYRHNIETVSVPVVMQDHLSGCLGCCIRLGGPMRSTFAERDERFPQYLIRRQIDQFHRRVRTQPLADIDRDLYIALKSPHRMGKRLIDVRLASEHHSYGNIIERRQLPQRCCQVYHHLRTVACQLSQQARGHTPLIDQHYLPFALRAKLSGQGRTHKASRTIKEHCRHHRISSPPSRQRKQNRQDRLTGARCKAVS